MLIQLSCSIQAFKGRHLPSVMNDGIMLTYATFALSITFSVTFPIVYFQQKIDKEVFQFGAIAINNFIISFIRTKGYPYVSLPGVQYKRIFPGATISRDKAICGWTF